MKEIISIGEKKKRINVVALLTNIKTGKSRVFFGANIVTNEGDKYYAEKAAGQIPSIDFSSGGMTLGVDTTAPSKTDTNVTLEDSEGRKAIDAGYPKTNDDDTSNTAASITGITWRVSYTTEEANINNISEVAIVNSIVNPTAALCHALFPIPFNKTSNDSLKIFINHIFSGI